MISEAEGRAGDQPLARRSRGTWSWSSGLPVPPRPISAGEKFGQRQAAAGTSRQTHIAVGIARACIRGGARGRFFNVVDLVNKLEAEARAGRQGRIADHLCRMDLVVLDELGYLPFAQAGGQLC